jgi:hypothetical protein
MDAQTVEYRHLAVNIEKGTECRPISPLHTVGGVGKVFVSPSSIIVSKSSESDVIGFEFVTDFPSWHEIDK